jgi:anti-sigma B factor antagonist
MADMTIGPVAIRAHGDLDLLSQPDLRSLLEAALAYRRPVVLDLEDVAFIDLAGLRALLDGSRLACSLGVTLTIRCPSPPVRRLLDVAGLAGVLAVDDAATTSGDRRLAGQHRQARREGAPGRDPELREHLAQVPLDRAGAEEEHLADLWVGEAVPGEASDLLLLWREGAPGIIASLADRLTGRRQLAPGALAEGSHADRREQVVS